MGITEILRRIWLFSVNKTKSSESFSKQPTQLIIVAHNCRNIMKLFSFFLELDNTYFLNEMGKALFEIP
jgi:hypothetical protein